MRKCASLEPYFSLDWSEESCGGIDIESRMC